MIVTDEMIRGNEILVELENLGFEYHQLNVRMESVYANGEAMRSLLEKAREVRLQMEALEVELKGLMTAP